MEIISENPANGVNLRREHRGHHFLFISSLKLSPVLKKIFLEIIIYNHFLGGESLIATKCLDY